jgi:hypothetical protein
LKAKNSEEDSLAFAYWDKNRTTFELGFEFLLKKGYNIKADE